MGSLGPSNGPLDVSMRENGLQRTTKKKDEIDSHLSNVCRYSGLHELSTVAQIL